MGSTFSTQVNGTFTAQARDPENQLSPLRVGGSVFSSTVPLGANASISTGWIENDGYVGLLYVIRSDKPSATNGIIVEYSYNKSTVLAGGLGNTYDSNDVNQLFQTALVPKATYTRITYTNGSQPQTNFLFEVKLSTSLVQPTEVSLNKNLTATNLGLVTKGVVSLPDGTGSYSDVTRTGSSANVHITNFPSTTPTRGYIWDQIAQGNGFMWTTGMMGVTGLLSNMRILIDNPANSGKNLHVFSLLADNATTTPVYGAVRINPTTNLPTTSKGQGSNLFVGNPKTSGGIEAYADVFGSAIGGGTLIGHGFLPPESETDLLTEAVYIVPPGVKIGVTIPYVISLGTVNNQMVLYGIVLPA